MANHFDNYDRALVIDGFSAGIADDPYSGISDMRNMEIISVPGEASVAMSTQTMIDQTSIQNTVIIPTDVLAYTWEYTGAPLLLGTAITLATTGALPTGYSTFTAYYVIDITLVSGSTYNIHLSTSAGGTVLPYIDFGSGTQTFTTIDVGTPKFYTSILLTPSGIFEYYYFMSDSNGRCWIYNSNAAGLTNTGTWVYMQNQEFGENPAFLTKGSGLIAYKGYLFNITPTYINVISIIDFVTLLPNLSAMTTISNWFFDWNQFPNQQTNSISHQAILSENDSNVYICNVSYLAEISEVAGSLAAHNAYSFNIANTHTIASGATTMSSKNIATSSAFFQSTDVGAVIVGTGIPTGTIIASIVDSEHAVLSANATATNTGLTFTITSAYNFDPEILPLPTNEQATCLTELGQNLLIGGINNYIYPWDRVSPNFFSPIFLSENHTYRMVTVNTNTYIFSGERGRIFITNGSNAQLWKKIPDHISGTVNPFFTWQDAIFNRNQLYFGFSVTDNQNNIINQYGGLWAIDVETQALRLVNQLSYGTYSGYASALYVNRGLTSNETQTNKGYGLFIGWFNGTSGGIDKGVSVPYTNSQSLVISELIPIGTYTRPRDLERIEYKLSRPLVAGESIQIYARLIFDTQDTGFGDPIINDSTAGHYSNSSPGNFKNAQWLQLKAITNSTVTNPSYVRLKEFRITGFQTQGPLAQIEL